MSKKKSFSGSTMTLKDFHGGSIPSDLTLPSAPGVSVRPPDRPSAWGGATVARGSELQYHNRHRQATSSGAAATASAAGPFLPSNTHIGCHFDEDERKPFDAAASAPRRPSPASVSSVASASAVRPVAVAPVANPWGIRKDPVPPEPTPPNVYSSAVTAASKLAYASAIDKVSSGRWHSKPQPDVEVIKLPEVDSFDRRFGDSVRITGDGDWGLKRQEAKERNDSVGSNLGGNREQERVRSPGYLEAKERNLGGSHLEGTRRMFSDGRFVGTQVNQQGMGEIGERPNLKLHPRMKMEALDSRPLDEKPLVMQKNQQPIDSGRIVHAYDVPGSVNPSKPGSAGSDGSSQAPERPRLNLKPRSQPLEQSDESSDKERKNVFGGARPRELVLKERGIDVVTANSIDVKVPVDRVKPETPKTEPKLVDSIHPANRHVERADKFPHELRGGKVLERKDHRPDTEKVDVQRISWKNDNWRSTKDREKPSEQRRPEPETWRKPVDEPKLEAPGPRFGKAASALELAQAFSKSVSDTRSDAHSGSKSLPGRPQLPFSRLTDTRDFHSGPPKTQINGY